MSPFSPSKVQKTCLPFPTKIVGMDGKNSDHPVNKDAKTLVDLFPIGSPFCRYKEQGRVALNTYVVMPCTQEVQAIPIEEKNVFQMTRGFCYLRTVTLINFTKPFKFLGDRFIRVWLATASLTLPPKQPTEINQACV